MSVSRHLSQKHTLRLRWAAATLVLLTVSAPHSAAHAASAADTQLANAAIRIDVDENGLLGLGTLAGTPESALDDDKRLLFGWAKASDVSSTSFSSVRISDTNGIADFSLAALPVTMASARVGDSIQTEWTISNSVRIRQSVSIMTNPFSTRQDLMRLEYAVSNIGGARVSVGVRAMLDVMIGDNDAAPYFVAGAGRSNLQRQFDTPNIPPYLVSFESNQFEPNSLKGVNVLSGYGLTTPDRVQIAHWRDLAMVGSTIPWQHTINPADTHGDSAVVAYWNPRVLNAGQSYAVATAFGLAGQGGGAMWLVAPVLVDPGTAELSIEGWVNNTTANDFGAGAITLTLPSGISFKPGVLAAQPITGVLAGQSAQARWRVVIDAPLTPSVYTYTAQAVLLDQTDTLTATARTIVAKTTRVLLPLTSR
jgi:hypothetical protein